MDALDDEGLAKDKQPGMHEMETDDEMITTENDDGDTYESEICADFKELKKAPPFNCKEKIVLFIDISSDMKSESLSQGRGNKSFLQVVKSSLQIFLATKRILKAEHEYAVVVMQDNAIIWLQGFTNDFQHICEIVEDLEAGEQCEPEETVFDFDQVVTLLQEHCDIPEVDDLTFPPPFVLRVIFIYGRSNCKLEISREKLQELTQMKASPYFFLDVLYVHELPSIGNNAKEIYDFFCNLDKEEKGYILEVSNSLKILYETMAKLICHPLQRSPQNEAFYQLMPSHPEYPEYNVGGPS